MCVITVQGSSDSNSLVIYILVSYIVNTRPFGAWAGPGLRLQGSINTYGPDSVACRDKKILFVLFEQILSHISLSATNVALPLFPTRSLKWLCSVDSYTPLGRSRSAIRLEHSQPSMQTSSLLTLPEKESDNSCQKCTKVREIVLVTSGSHKL